MEQEQYQEELIKDFLKSRPTTITVIAYGSAIKKQHRDKNIIQKQIDLILGVEDPRKWHKANRKINPKDYSLLGYAFLTKTPNCIYKFGTNINYLTYLPHHGSNFKIGIIQNDDLIDDLINWNNGYMAGRMQKSVKIIKGSDKIKAAIERNRENALKISLLLINPATATRDSLYEKICSLSYNGDIRMVAKMENPNKVKDIAIGSYIELKDIYDKVNHDYFTDDNGTIKINYGNIFKEFDNLPDKLKNKIDFKGLNEDDLQPLRDEIEKFFYKNNLKASIAQPIKGIITNSIVKSYTYAKNKRRKHNIYR